MKALITVVVSFFLVSVLGNPTLSPDKPVLLFSVSSKTIVRLGVVNRTAKVVKLTIQENQSQMVFEKNIKPGESYFEFHNLSKLPTGKYTVSVSRGKVSETKNFIIEEEGIKILSQGYNIKIQKSNFFVPKDLNNNICFIKRRSGFQNIGCFQLDNFIFNHVI